jgi:hypothetical protein
MRYEVPPIELSARAMTERGRVVDSAGDPAAKDK